MSGRGRGGAALWNMDEWIGFDVKGGHQEEKQEEED
jgi:hypothetical protein